MESLADVVDARAAEQPDAPAFLSGARVCSWAQYAARSDALAARLVALGLQADERVAVLMPDGPGVHTAFLACEKAGLVAVGIGPRAAEQEILHLLGKTRAAALLAPPTHRGIDFDALLAPLRSSGLRHRLSVPGELEPAEGLVVDGTPAPLVEPSAAERDELGRRRLAPDDVFLVNSTSGTTGLAKCVVHDQARWNHFHELAVEAGELSCDDRFLSAIPAPFGFGIWTAHVTPTRLGAPTVLAPSFEAERTIAAIERHRVSVLAAVSTQFIMMLDSPALQAADLSSLRVLFTGGERVPYERAAEFEERTGACVLQFYGSNETGALSRTRTRDSREVRLRSAGHVIPQMQVRLFDDSGADVTATGRGQPGCRGPLLSRGYLDDDAANAELIRPDGWMLTGDLATLDADGVLRVVGRTGDFIIRGGKNVSGPAVEEAVTGHPNVAIAAAVAMPDPTFGERVCVYAVLRPGCTLTLDALIEDLRVRGVSPETWPERLEIVDELPRSSGGKVHKARLREEVRARMAEGSS